MDGETDPVSRTQALLRLSGLNLLVAVAYLLLGMLCLQFALSKIYVSPLWLPAGLAWAVIRLFGWRLLPGIWLGTLALVCHRTQGEYLLLALLIATSNSLASALSVWLYRSRIRHLLPIDQTKAYLVFLLCVVPSALVSASFGVLWLTLLALAPPMPLLNLLWTWWSGDLTGIVVFAPLLMALYQHQQRPVTPVKAGQAEQFLALTLLVGLGFCAFSWNGNPTVLTHLLLYCLCPCLLWLVFRCNLLLVLTGELALTLISTDLTVLGLGPFIWLQPEESLLALQSFIGMMVVASTVVSLSWQEQFRLRQFLQERTQNVLEQSHRKYQSLVDNAGVALICTDADGTIFDWNPQAESFFGWSRVELLGQNYIQRFVRPEDHELTRKLFARICRGEPCQQLEYRILHRDGSERTLLWSLRPVLLGNQLGVLASGQDISRRKEMEAVLQSSKLRWQAVFEQAADIMLLMDAYSGQVLEFNTAAQQQLGYARDQFLTMALWQFSADMPSMVIEHLSLTRNQGNQILELRFKTQQGSLIDVQLHSRLLSLHEQPLILTTIRDISERRFWFKFEEGRSRLLEMIAAANSLSEILEAARTFTESLYPEARLQVALCDESSSLGPVFSSISSIQGPHRAVLDEALETGLRVVSIDPAQLPPEQGCIWAQSMISSQEMALGVVALFWPFAPEEDKSLLAFVRTLVYLLGIALEQQQARVELSLFYRLAENSSQGFALVSFQGRFLYGNAALARLLGVKRVEELLGRELAVLHDASSRELVQTSLKQVLQGQSWAGEVLLRRDDGSLLAVAEQFFLLKDDSGRPHCLACLVQDISERKAFELSLSQFSEAIEQSASMVLFTSRQGRITYLNRSFIELSGYSPDELLGQTPEVFQAEGSQDAFRQLQQAMRLGRSWRGELCNRHRNGELYWTLTSLSCIQDDQGEISHFVLVSEDVTENKAQQQIILRHAQHDALTGLCNRRYFIEQLEQYLQYSLRYGSQGALLFLDMDQFKRVNDTLGHEAGDHLLAVVSQRLKDAVRTQDVVARLGGDEFTLLLTDIPDVQAVERVSRHILDSLALPIALVGQEIAVTTSIGITLFPHDGSEWDILMKNADMAMYRAKEQGRNNFQFFVPEMNLRAHERLRLENELRQAFQNGQFQLYFQPLMDLQHGGCVALEALVRWHHPVEGLVAPGRFIPVAEESGLIVPLGYWVLEESCQTIRQLRSQYPNLKVAVNISIRQFRDPKLADRIEALLQRFELEPQALELEITETMLMGDLADILAVLNRLKALGISICIDDFGTGYSSLSYLKQLPVDVLKVDQSFVKDIPFDENDMEIAAAVIAMAHKLKLKVVAEGIEQPEQIEFLLDNQCDIGQGYLFSAPKPLTALQQLLPELNRWRPRPD